MLKLAVVLPALCAAVLHAEVHSLTLRQAVERALMQNPEIAFARLDEQRATQSVRIAKDPFTPRITVGSGLAYTSGFPMSIEGAAPSIVQARAVQFIFNRQQNYAVAQAKEEAKGASLNTAAKKDDVVFRAVSLFLDAERAARLREMAAKEVESQQRVAQVVETRVGEGRELPLASKQVAVSVARARQAVELFEAEQDSAESSLTVLLGYPVEDRVRPVLEERAAPEVPANEEEAIETAIRANGEMKRLESAIVAKQLSIRGEKAARLPRVDLVAQYGLFARFNNYEDFFRRFQRHNGQLGVSFQLPLLPGPGIDAITARAEAEIAQLRIQIRDLRNKTILNARQTYREIRKARTASEVARLDLEAAREQLSVLLAQMQEGRAPLRQVEEARAAENQKWIALYDAQYALEKVRWSLLRQTGELMAALKPK